MSRWLPTALAILAALAAQVALAPHLALGGSVPNLLLLVVVTLAFVRGAGSGLYGGFFAGLALDLIGTGPVGAWAMVLALTGYATGMAAANVFAEGWLLPTTVAALASLVAETAYALHLALLGQGATFWDSLTGRALPEAVYTAVLALLAYPWLVRFLRREPRLTQFGRVG